MKTVVVPAQVTTVEDKVAGNLSFTQLILLSTPILIFGIIYIFIPPFTKITILKMAICLILTFFCMTMAIRIKEKILMMWLILIITYNLRPKYYVFNKNDHYLRPAIITEPKVSAKQKATKEITSKAKLVTDVAIPELIKLEKALSDPRAMFHLKTTKKGALNVYITEVDQEGLI